MKINLPVVGFVVAFCSGGLAGAVFKWYVDRRPPVTLIYALTSTTLGASSAVKSLVPNLKLQIGGEEVPVIHTHSVEFKTSEFLESAEVAIFFVEPMRLYGVSAEAPTVLQKMTCTPINQGWRCTMGPLKAESGAFKFTIVNNVEEPPVVQMVAKNVELRKEDVSGGQQNNVISWTVGVGATMLILVFLVGLLLAMWMTEKNRVVSPIQVPIVIDWDRVVETVERSKKDKPKDST